MLDGRVDPRSLTLTAHLKDGSHSHIHTVGERPGLAHEQAARRTAGSGVPRTGPGGADHAAFGGRADRRNAQGRPCPCATRRAGRPWVLRSWRSIYRNSGSASGLGVLQYCFQFGVIDNSNLVLPRTGVAPILLNAPGHPTSESSEERCNSTKVLTRNSAQFSVESYLADPYAYSPTVVRTIVSGQAPLGSTRVLLIGAGPARALAVDGNDAFLIVLPGRYWANRMHLAYTLDGRTHGIPGHGGTPQRGPGLRPEARAPDPDGGAPWGFAERGSSFNGFGRIVEGRIAGIEEARGTVIGRAGETLKRAPGQAQPGSIGQPQVQFHEQPEEETQGIAGHVAPLTRAQIERRTLPGRTIITGIAQPDVVSVTLTTPSDVRTLRPSGRHHLIIAVYAGVFHQANPTATILLRDGKTITEPILGFAPQSVRSRTPQQQLQDIYRQQAAVEHDPQLTEAQRRLLSGGVPARARLIRLRIAFERAHPGLLPAP